MVQLQLPLSLDRLTASFPLGRLPSMRPGQRQAFALIADQPDSGLIIEAPTGSGKTAIGYTYLRALSAAADGPLFYIAPNKTHVDEVHTQFPDTYKVYGRNEYDCLYYQDQSLRADEIPCISLQDCGHRVNQTTGKTVQEGATPCPYLKAKYRTRQSGIIVCTMAFFLYTRLFARDPIPLGGLVIDEAHRIATTFRGALSYDISDWNLRRAVRLLRHIGADTHADNLDHFLTVMIRILRSKSPDTPTILRDEELEELAAILKRVDSNEVQRKLSEALAAGKIDPVAEREVLRQLETVAFNLRRYVLSLTYALPTGDRAPLNYVTYAYSHSKPQGQEKVQYRLVIRAYHVAPLVRKLLPANTLAYSATIGNPQVFGFETGLRLPFFALENTFPAENTAIFMPSDTPNLAHSKKQRAEPTKVLRRIAKMIKRLRGEGHRSLVIVVSDEERQKFLRLCREEEVAAVSYGESITPRQAIARFKDGEGDVLVGTSANYGEGIDLPDRLAPVTFFLRPGYPSPNDPATQFEQRRYGKGQSWALWNWRVMVEALQVRGRNVRSHTDRGVTVLVSQQFSQFVYSTLPEWLRPSYKRGLTLEECCQHTLKLLSPQKA